MLVWCIYDITKDKTRNKIAKTAQRYGLYRVQKSVFVGTVNDNKLDEFSIVCNKEIDEETDSVFIFPLCEKDFKSVITHGQALDRKLITDEIKNLFC